MACSIEINQPECFQSSMIEVDANTLLSYFANQALDRWRSLGLTIADLSNTRVSELAWGVSNIVLRVDAPSLSFVVKQSREQLRTPIDWFSQLERVWRETAMLRSLNEILPAGVVPQVLFEDRDNYLFAMEAVEADHLVWKAELLNGRFDDRIAPALAQHLAKIHSYDVTGYPHPDKLAILADRDVFDELRLDPFYRYMAQTIPDLRDVLLDLIETTLKYRPMSLVLADFSPKNILLTKRGPVIVDFETGHLGDPAFDIGFFLSHLLLKFIYQHPKFGPDCARELMRIIDYFWVEYANGIKSSAAAWLLDDNSGPKSRDRRGLPESTGSPAFERQCVRHLAACMLSRVDGKSRVDYLTTDSQKQLVREFSRELLLGDCASIPNALGRLKDRTLQG